MTTLASHVSCEFPARVRPAPAVWEPPWRHVRPTRCVLGAARLPVVCLSRLAVATLHLSRASLTYEQPAQLQRGHRAEGLTACHTRRHNNAVPATATALGRRNIKPDENTRLSTVRGPVHTEHCILFFVFCQINVHYLFTNVLFWIFWKRCFDRETLVHLTTHSSRQFIA